MRNSGTIQSQLNEIESLLSSVDILDERVFHNSDYLAGVIGVERRDGYIGGYEYCISTRKFDFRLKNHSLLQFAWKDDTCTFRYLEAPLEVVDYEEFVTEVFGFEGEDAVELGDALREEYAAYTETAGLKKTILPIRYDYDSSSYKAGHHPAAHIHIGYSTPLRIENDRQMNPLSFVYFILRHQYPYEWLRVLDSRDCRSIARSIRDSLQTIPAKFQQPEDKAHLRLW